MSTRVLDQLRADLRSRRVDLVQERHRLEEVIGAAQQQLGDLNAAIETIDGLLGHDRPPAIKKRTAEAPVSTPRANLQQLRLEILRELEGAYPAGLTSAQLVERIQPRWPEPDLTTRKIGTNAAQMPAVLGNGALWYYVPTGPSQTDDSPLLEVQG